MPSPHEISRRYVIQPARPASKKLAAQLYLAVWRWHFWAGLLVSPVLIILAITGTLIVFQPQLEPLIDRNLYFVGEGGASRVPMQTFADAVARELPGFHLAHLYAYPDPERSWDGFAFRPTEEGIVSRRVFFDWNRGELLGDQDYNSTFFRQVIDIHRSLLAGLPGRIVTEIATSWGIVSVLSGLYLWWPRKRGKGFGVWLPHVRGATRTVLRDWHTVPAVYLSLVLLIIMGTGLFFSKIWGTGFKAAAFATGGFPDFVLSPPTSAAPVDPHRPMMTVDEAIVRAAQRHNFADETFEIVLPAPGSNESFQILTANNLPWRPTAILFLDAFSGKELLYATGADLPWQSHLARLFYPLHTGSVLGLPTQILALLACILLVTTTSLGVLMWWRRRPPGSLGSPRRPPPGAIPAWMIWCTAGLAILLPTVGLTLIGVYLCGLLRDLRRGPSESTGLKAFDRKQEKTHPHS